MRIMIMLVAALSLTAGCATTDDPGWQGQNATPFASAEAECNAEAAAAAGAQELTFRTCMSRHGWSYRKPD